MRVLNLALALCGTLLTIVGAAPTASGVKFDVNSVKATCGSYGNIPQDTTIDWFQNSNCAFCIIKNGHDANGDIVYAATPGPRIDGKFIASAQSYFCYQSLKSVDDVAEAATMMGIATTASALQPRDDNTRDVVKPGDTAFTQQPTCGTYMLIEEEAVMPLYASGHYENVEEAVHMLAATDLACGFCIFFAGRDAQGDVLYSGGPDPAGTTAVRGAQSYYCY
ncbi:hypothetical protein EK21DRAFT_114633 [Setomelanomma holmii]|uniref:Uncharacterized protein n=1 Tax=Setomelanomma holmii TaxID=210430 RepID=A0A9P4H3U2_9PLEO|nr:hypothetical protein EK21DRAFT_114633 [Setomelanomma holmii]